MCDWLCVRDFAKILESVEYEKHNKGLQVEKIHTNRCIEGQSFLGAAAIGGSGILYTIQMSMVTVRSCIAKGTKGSCSGPTISQVSRGVRWQTLRRWEKIVIQVETRAEAAARGPLGDNDYAAATGRWEDKRGKER